MASRAKDASLGLHLQLAGAVQANQGDMPHIEGLIGKYLGAVDNFQQAAQVQSALIASKQEASKKVTSTRTEANRIGTIVKATLRDHYGADSDWSSSGCSPSAAGPARPSPPRRCPR